MEKLNQVVNLGTYKKENNLMIKNEHNRLYETYYTEYFKTDSEFTNFAKKAVRMARSSPHYDYYLANMIGVYGIDSCFILSNVNNQMDGVAIEMHHYPFTIFDIACIVINKKIMLKEPISTPTVSKEMMQLHFRNIVGLVPTSETVHQLAHDGQIFIPLTSVFGKVSEFVREYEEYIPPALLDSYNTLVEKTENGDEVDFNNILEVRPLKWGCDEDLLIGEYLE